MTATIPTVEKTFQRLLLSTEKLLDEKSIEDWKLDQFVKALTNMLKEMPQSMKRSDEYKQRIDRLRHNVDPIKLEDQTFPRQVLRQIQADIPIKEQQTDVIVPSVPSTEAEKNVSTSNKSSRQNLNRQQEYIQSEEDKQDDIATAMSVTTRSLLNSAQRVHDIVRAERKKLDEAVNLVDTNTAKLNVQTKRLKHNAYSGSSCWIYLMLIVVIVTFIYLTLFMRMFRRRIITTVYSTKGSQSNLLDKSLNETTINTTNITTTTKSTDYISLLLNYANENHTDL